MHKIINFIWGIVLLLYTLVSFFVSNGSAVRFILVLTILLIFSVALERGNAKKTAD
ncbi:hypothetical protein [Bacillus sp. R86525]|uniref:hypothetical protein n=1 Tax=Bacillus sp. R86525 TaxID=3101709 RepID=UPI003673240C